MRTTDAATRWLATALMIAVAALLIGVVRALLIPPVPDVAWYLYAGGRLLEGDRLYVDLVDINPPLILWIKALVVAIARATSTDPARLYLSGVLVLGCISVVSTSRLGLAYGVIGRRRLPWLVAALACVTLALPGLDFGQREHLLVLALLPYLCLASTAAPDRHPAAWQRAVIGALAGLGLCLKPHFAAVWIVVELFVQRRTRRGLRRPEAIVAGGVLVTYWASVLLAMPEYVSLVERLAPVYRAYYREPMLELLRAPGAVIMLGGVLLHVTVPSDGRGGGAAKLLIVAGTTLLLAALVQQKGWAYHFYPPFALGTLLIVVVHARILEADVRGTRVAAVLSTALLVVAGVYILFDAWRGFDMARAGEEEFAESRALLPVVRQHAAAGPLVIFSPTHTVAFPLVNRAGARWGMRYNSLWPVRGFLEQAPRDPRIAAARDTFIADVVTDLVTSPPGLLLVDVSAPAEFGGDSLYFHFFGRDPRFRELMARYRTVGYEGRYLVLVRQDPPTGAESSRTR